MNNRKIRMWDSKSGFNTLILIGILINIGLFLALH